MRPVAILLLLSLAAAASAADPVAHLDSQLSRVRSDTALILPSQAIDEFALWSPDARYLAVNVEGEWLKVDLGMLILEPAAWRGSQPIGVITNRDAVTSAAAEDVAAWQTTNTLRPRRADVGTVRVELREGELSTALVVSSPGRKPVTRWTSDGENCHSLVVAPTGRHVAFICEMTGMFVLQTAPGG